MFRFPFGKGGALCLHLNQNSIEGDGINDFGHEIDNAVALSTMKGVAGNVKKAKSVCTDYDGD